MFEQFTFLLADLNRWKANSLKDIFYLIFERAIWATILYRLARAIFLMPIPVVKVLFRFVSFFIYKFSELLFGVSIPPGTEIGPGLYIGHAGNILLHHEVKCGANLSIGPGIVIGQRGMGAAGVPTIGNDVYLGVGVKILGNVQVGNNIRAGANSVIVENVPDNVVVFGVPAKVIGPVFAPKKKKV